MSKAASKIAVIPLIISLIPLIIPSSHSFQNATPVVDDAARSLDRILSILEQLRGKGLNVEELRGILQGLRDKLSSEIASQEKVEIATLIIQMRDRLERVLSKILLNTDRQGLVGQVLEITTDIVKLQLSGTLTGIANSLIESGGGLVEDALSQGLEEKEALKLLSRSRTLVTAAQQIVGNGKVNLKISKGGDPDTEINIAHIQTSSQDIKVYQSEEKITYDNNTVVSIRRTIISVENTTIIERETYRISDGSGGVESRTVGVGEGLAIGAVLALKATGPRIDVERTEFDITLNSYNIEGNLIRLILSAPDGTLGRLIVVDISREVSRGLSMREIAVRIDGKQVPVADNVVELLRGNASQPKYFIALTGNGVQLVIYVPKWSTRVITIGPAAVQVFYFPVSELAGNNLQWMATLSATLVFVLIAVASYLKYWRPREAGHPYTSNSL
ncbi:hypothetical protein HRbin01_00936 [archaeon HR01]|nr:hypothetical protein HRbin01_00936 [archaeon HR01]